MEPTIVYKIPGPCKGPKGHTHDWRGVKTEIELAKAVAEGYFKTMEEAMDAVLDKGEFVPPVNPHEDVPQDKIKSKPAPIKNLDGEEIKPGAIGELPKRKAGRPKKKKEIFGDDG